MSKLPVSRSSCPTASAPALHLLPAFWLFFQPAAKTRNKNRSWKNLKCQRTRSLSAQLRASHSAQADGIDSLSLARCFRLLEIVTARCRFIRGAPATSIPFNGNVSKRNQHMRTDRQADAKNPAPATVCTAFALKVHELMLNELDATNLHVAGRAGRAW